MSWTNESGPEDQENRIVVDACCGSEAKCPSYPRSCTTSNHVDAIHVMYMPRVSAMATVDGFFVQTFKLLNACKYEQKLRLYKQKLHLLEAAGEMAVW